MWRRTFSSSKEKTKPSRVAETGAVKMRAQGLAMEMRLSPTPLRLSQTRVINVHVTVENVTKRLIHLNFPTSERLEILLSDEAGKTLVRWSDDRAVSPFPSYVSVNPGEKIEYNETLSTRDLSPGRPCTVIAFFPNFPHLTIKQTIIPE